MATRVLLGAPAAVPQLQSTFPLAIARGETSEITVRGSNLSKVSGILFDFGDTEISAKILGIAATENPPAKPASAEGKGAAGAKPAKPGAAGPIEEMHLMIQVSDQAQPGAYAFRAFGPSGLSNFGTLVVTAASPSREQEQATSPAHPQRIAIPSTISGRISKNGEVDYYEIDVAARQTLQFEAMTAPGIFRGTPASFMDPQLTVLERTGSWFDADRLQPVEMADESFIFFNPPSNQQNDYRRPRFTHQFDRAGKYLVAVRSINGAGSPDHIYLLRVAPVDASTPADLSRWFPSTALHRDPGIWQDHDFERHLQSDRASQLQVRSVPAAAKNAAMNPAIPLVALKKPNQSVEQAMPLPIPSIVEGTIAEPGEADYFRITAKAGEKLAFEIETPQATFPYFAPLLLILDAKGQKLYDNIYRKVGGDGDDWIKSVEPKTIVTFSKDGDYYVAIRDLTQRKAGPLYQYRLVIRPQIPHVGEISAANFGANRSENPEDRLNLSPGDVRNLIVLTGLEEGFDGSVTLSIDNLPPGIEVAATAAAPIEIPSYPGETIERLGTSGKERYRPVRLGTTLTLIVHGDAAPTPEPRMIHLVARPVQKNSIGRPIIGKQIALMIVPGGKGK